MRVKLAYGKHGLDVNLPETAHVIAPRFVPGLPDEDQAVREALRHPIQSPALTTLVKPGRRIVIAHTDITRATPNDRILPVILAELEAAGARREDITLLNGLGTHRPQTEAELRTMLGDFVVKHYRCKQHNAFDDAGLISLGTTAQGHPVRVNRLFLESDLRILTGFIEPHFFAGFSGGPKGVLPALCGAESVLSNHGVDMIAHPKATWGITAGNPIWEEMREMALKAKVSFLVNVAMNVERRITGVFAGEILAAHAAGCEFVKATAMIPIPAAFDIVITTNSGYPLDQNLYQSVKGMSAARGIVRAGGALIIAAACADGLPEHGKYADLLARGKTPQGVLDLVCQPGFSSPDQWQVQIQALLQKHCDIYVFSAGLTDTQIKRALLKPCRNIEKTLADLLKHYGAKATLCVLPEGPQTIAYVDRSNR